MPPRLAGIGPPGAAGAAACGAELWPAPRGVGAPARGAPRGPRWASSFIKDCSNRGAEGLTPGCRRLRDLFRGKEVVGEKIEKCGEPPGERRPPPRWPGAKPPRVTPERDEVDEREEYIHDAQTDLWYHCCEQRSPWKDFSVEADPVRVPPGADKAQSSIASNVMGMGGKAEKSANLKPKGAALRCNMMQNLKHMQDESSGDREVVDEVSGSAASGLIGLGTKCVGDERVALQKFAGGAIMRVLTDDVGQCVDIGPHGASTPRGQPYHVFELSVAPSAALLAGWPAAGRRGSRRPPRDFL